MIRLPHFLGDTVAGSLRDENGQFFRKNVMKRRYLNFFGILYIVILAVGQIFSCFYEISAKFPEYDLAARTFGAGLGVVYGLLTAVGCYGTLLVMNHSISVIQKRAGKKLPENSPPEKNRWEWFQKIAGYVLKFLFFLLIMAWLGSYVGYSTGERVDWEYSKVSLAVQYAPEWAESVEVHFSPWIPPFLFVLPLALAAIIFATYFFQKDRSQIPALVLGLVICGFFFTTLFFMAARDTRRLTLPNLVWRPVELEEGIYVYANDNVYNVSMLNIYSSRLKGFEHTGLCLLTRRPGEVNSPRLERGEKSLRFEYLDRGYFISDLNLDVADRDGLANHGSRTSLSDVSYPFDIQGFRNLLAGRSVNDRLRPAVCLARVETADPVSAWDEVIRFRDEFNAKYPEGFIYSPIPYRGKHAACYNCNTVTAAILGGILGMDGRYDFMTRIPLCFGGQTAADGKKMLEEMMGRDRKPEMARQREFMENSPFARQAFWHRMLHKDGWLYGVVGEVTREEVASGQ